MPKSPTGLMARIENPSGFAERRRAVLEENATGPEWSFPNCVRRGWHDDDVVVDPRPTLVRLAATKSLPVKVFRVR